jgi:hypothetical protein
MPTTTANQQIPLPVDTDDPNIPDDLNTLATFLEHQIVGIYTTTSDRDTRANSTAKEGQVAFVKADNSFWVWNGSTWDKMYISYSYVPAITSGTAAPSGGNNGDVYFKV